jgi:uncharacterized membrane protein
MHVNEYLIVFDLGDVDVPEFQEIGWAVGVPDHCLHRVLLLPHRSGCTHCNLFALTSGATAPERVIDELKQYDFEFISTNLPEEQENKLREAFAQE